MTQSAQQPTARFQGIRAWSQSCYQRLFAIDLRTLALFRISIALVMTVDLARRARDLSTMYAQGGALPLSAVHDYYGEFWKWSLHLWSDAWGYQAFLFGLAGICGLALLIGYHTRVATCAAWILTVSLNTRAPVLVNGGDVLLCMGLFWAMFLPLGSRFSIDARGQRQPAGSTQALSVACVGILLQVGMMYLFTGLWKFNPAWLNGEALGTVMSDTAITRSFGDWLSGCPQLLHTLSQATLWLELIGPLLLFTPFATHYLRPLALVCFVGLHLGIEMSITVLMFSYASLAMLTLFVPGTWWNWLGLRAHEPLVIDQTKSGRRFGFQSTWSSWSKRVGQVLGWCCIGYITLYNVFSLRYRQGWPQGLTGFSQVGTLLSFGQRWSMFDHPEQHLYRFAFYGRLKDGRHVELLRSQITGEDVSCPDSAVSYPTDRWMQLYRELTAPAKSVFRHDVARYLSSQWNQGHTDSEQFMEGTLAVYSYSNADDTSETQRRELVYFDARSRGPIRFGLPHGRWTLHHDNGTRSAQGRYKHGQETGKWTFWDEAGKREAEGTFTLGKKQGTWTFWYDDGSVKTGIFQDDELPERLP